MKFFYVIFLGLFFVYTVDGQITLIPDESFEFRLVIEGIDTDGVVNGQVLTTDIADETSLIIPPMTMITDLTGIQDFTSLENLDIGQAEIENLDLSQNINLNRLSLADLSLFSLNLESNVDLEILILMLNGPGSIYFSSLSDIDLSQNINLRLVNIVATEIYDMDVSANTNLEIFELHFMDNLLNVNLKNTNNSNINFLRIEDNANLQCVQVDDPQGVINGVDPPYDNWIIENDPIITDDCQLGVAEYLSNQVSLVPNPTAGKLYLEVDRLEVEGLFLYDTLGRLVLSKTNEFNSMDLSQLPQGFYLLEIETDEGKLTKKIVKE